MTNATITISQTQATQIATMPTCWVIISGGEIVSISASRSTAREIKSVNGINGSIAKAADLNLITFHPINGGNTGASQVLADEVDSQDPTDAEIAESNMPVAPVGSALEHDAHSYRCPGCGIHLCNGVGEHNQEVNGKKIKHDQYEFCCLGCGAEFGPAIPSKKVAKAVAPRGPVTHESTATRPCKLVWQIADDVFLANPEAKRSEVLAECVKQGVAYFTARTQYQQWLTVQKEMAAREAEQASKAAK
jgi:hypothetical protein